MLELQGQSSERLGEDPDNSRGYSKLNALASLTPHESKYRVLSESMLWLQK
jgi:hypothetical protein